MKVNEPIEISFELNGEPVTERIGQAKAGTALSFERFYSLRPRFHWKTNSIFV